MTHNTEWKSHRTLMVYHEQFLDWFSYEEIEDIALGIDIQKYIDILPNKMFRLTSKKKVANYYEQLVVHTLLRDARANGTLFSDELRNVMILYSGDIESDDISNTDEYYSTIIRFAIDVIANEIMDFIEQGSIEYKEV